MTKSLSNLLVSLFKIIVNLMNMHHMPIGIIYKDKNKIVTFGSNNLKEYLKMKAKTDAELLGHIDQDAEEMSFYENADYYPVEAGSAHRVVVAGLQPSLLPFPLEYMNFKELCDWLSKFNILIYFRKDLV